MSEMTRMMLLMLSVSAELVIGTQRSSADDFTLPWPDTVPHTVFALPSAGSPVLLPVTAGKRQLVFIVDTTMPWSIVNMVHQDWLEPIKDDRTGDKTKSFKFPSLLVGRLPLPVMDRIRSADLIGYEGVLGRSIDGVFGTDILRKLVIYVDNDCDKGAIALADAASFVPREASLDVKYDRNGAPTVELSAGGIMGQFYFDMIAWHSATLTPELVNTLISTGDVRLNDTFRFVSDGNGGHDIRLDLRCSKLTIGRSHVRDTVCFKDDRNAVAYGILSRYRITLVLSQNRIVLLPGRSIDCVDHTDKDGIEIVKLHFLRKSALQ